MNCELKARPGGRSFASWLWRTYKVLLLMIFVNVFIISKKKNYFIFIISLKDNIWSNKIIHLFVKNHHHLYSYNCFCILRHSNSSAFSNLKNLSLIKYLFYFCSPDSDLSGWNRNWSRSYIRTVVGGVWVEDGATSWPMGGKIWVGQEGRILHFHLVKIIFFISIDV